jgi:hypothetical protein
MSLQNCATFVGWPESHEVPECHIRQAVRPKIENVNSDQNRSSMYDLIFIGVVVVFFIVSAFYVRFCEKL